MNALIQYARNENRIPIGVLVAEKVAENEVLIGWSGCHSGDDFIKAKGLHIARGRIKCGASGCIVPRSLRPLLPNFINRCERYFKTECVIVVGRSEEEAFVR